MVADEEQKFGVAYKEKNKTLAIHCRVRVYRHTPIPRFSIDGRERPTSSTLHRLTGNRFKPKYRFNEDLIRGRFILKPERRAGVLFITVWPAWQKWLRLFRHFIAPIFPSDLLMVRWKAVNWRRIFWTLLTEKYDVLVCTNIVESGVDIPNVNTIIINNAH